MGRYGVTADAADGAWTARIWFRGRDYRLGQYKSLDAAIGTCGEAEAMLLEPTLRRYGRGGGDAGHGYGQRG